MKEGDMRIGIIVLASLLIAACSSADALRKKTAADQFESQRTPEQLAKCIMKAWNDQRIGYEANGAALTEDGDVRVVSSPATGIPSEIAEISARDATSFVSIHAQASLDVGGRTRKRSQAARACQ